MAIYRIKLSRVLDGVGVVTMCTVLYGTSPKIMMGNIKMDLRY